MQKRYWKKNKRQKFTDDFIKSLQPPSVKLETINDTKSNIFVRNYRSGGKVFWADINVLLNRVKTNQRKESRRKLYFSAAASTGLILFGLIIF